MQRKLIFAGLIVGLTFVAGSASAGPLAERQQNQRARIQQGVENGSLTPWERARLNAEQRSIGNMRKLAKNDGQVTRSEAKAIQRAQDRSSHHIYGQKHD